METEGNGARPCRFHPFTTVAAWRHGARTAAPFLTIGLFPRKKLGGALRSALASKFADGKLVVVNAFDVKEPKTKQFRQALDALNVETTCLLVEVPRHGNRNLHSGLAQP